MLSLCAVDVATGRPAAVFLTARLRNLTDSALYAERDAIFIPEVRFQYPLGDLNGVEAVKGYIAAVRTAFPDVQFTVEDVFGEGERVAARWRLAWTQTGVFRGKLPSGKHVTVSGNTIFRVQSGKIHEMWVAFDPAGPPRWERAQRGDQSPARRV